MKHILLIVQCCIFFVINTNLYAQQLAPISSMQLDRSDIKNIESFDLKRKTSTVNPALNTGIVSNLASINLLSSFNDNRAEARLGFISNKSTFSLSVAQSYTSKPKNVTFFDADGLNTGTSFSLSWQTPISKIKIPTTLPITDLSNFKKIKDEFKKEKKIADSIGVSFDDFTPEYRKKVIESGVINLDAFASPWLLALKLTISKVNFDYVTDSLSLKPLSEQKNNKGLTISLSKFINLDSYVSFSYSLLLNNKSGDDIISYNFPIGNTGVSYSKEVTVGMPKESTDSKFKIELRKVIRNNDFVPKIGFNPSISYFFKKEKINIEFPIYLLTKNDEDKFNGLQLGFKVGYTTKFDSFINDLFDFNSNKMYLGLFVSKPFLVKD